MEELKPSKTVSIPFHGPDVEGMEELRLNLLTCKECGSFEHFIATKDENDTGDLKAFVCCKCRYTGVPETISIKAFNNIRDTTMKNYRKIRVALAFYRFGFFIGSGFIIYLTFIR